MNGQINEHPFAELLREISYAKLDGALRLERIKAVVYFEKGAPVFAASNIRTLRLSEYILKRELLSAGQLAALGDLRSDAALIKELTKRDLLQPAAIAGALTALVMDVMRVAMLWSEGSWAYDSQAQPAESIRVNISTRSFLLEGARKMGLKFVLSRLPNPSEMISPAAAPANDYRLLPEEAFVMSRVDQRLPLKEVITLSGLREMDAMRTVYGLALADCLKRESWPNALGTAIADTSEEVTAPAPAQKSDAEKLAEFFERVEGATSHYDVLNVSQAASITEIKGGYYMLARRYHPDRFHSQDVHSRVEDAFARITQAYETLVDVGQRNTYDAKLAAQERARQLGESAPRAKGTAAAGEKPETASELKQRAEASFKEGFAALKIGQLSAAIPYLAAAAQNDPDEARYRAYYGQALAMQGTSQRRAELELQSAVQLDPASVTYRLMLANLYFELKFLKRSQSEAEKALAMDPNNVIAQELLKKLESTG